MRGNVVTELPHPPERRRLVMVIERIFCCESCGKRGADPVALSHPKPGETGQTRCHGPVVSVEFVPHSELTGAVRERDTFARALMLAVASPELREAYVRQAETALSRTRGQSDG